MKNELEILNLYTDPDSLRDVLKAPFEQNGYVVASDGYCLIRIEKSVINGSYNHQDYPKIAGEGSEKLFPSTNHGCRMSIDDFREAIKDAPQIEETKVVRDAVKCEECEGEGSVVWVYEASARDYEEEYDCPVCNGCGYSKEIKEKTGRMIADPEAATMIQDRYFLVRNIERMIRTMELLEADDVWLRFDTQRPYEQMQFEFVSKKVDGLMMPVRKPEN